VGRGPAGPATAGHAGTGGCGRRRRTGLWAALRDVFPATRQQRDWVHKVANVLGCLPKSVQAGARRALVEIRDAPDRDHAQRAIQAFASDYGTKWPKAVAKIADDAEPLLCFLDFPAEHWVHLKTSNPMESTFASVRLRTRVTKGPGSKAAGLAMAFKLLESAQDRWRAVNGRTWSRWCAPEHGSTRG
jgi:putative transposase